MRFSIDGLLRDSDSLIQWSKLKLLQNNKIVKTSYIWLLLVPFVTKLFSKISNNLIFSIHGKIYEFDLILPFSWKIFFISALFFTLGNLFFYIFSPSIVKNYKDYGDFKTQGKTHKQLEDYFSKVDHSNHMGRIINNEGQAEDNKLFWEIYEDRDKYHYKQIRYITFLFYGIGLSLSLYVFSESIFWVISSWF